MKMNKSLFRTAVSAMGVWLAVFQFAGFSQGAVTENSAAVAKSAPAPFNYTGLPKVIVVSGTNYEMGVQYGEQAAAAINKSLPFSRAASTRRLEAPMLRRI